MNVPSGDITIMIVCNEAEMVPARQTTDAKGMVVIRRMEGMRKGTAGLHRCSGKLAAGDWEDAEEYFDPAADCMVHGMYTGAAA